MNTMIFRLARTNTDGQTIAGRLIDGADKTLCVTLEPGHKVSSNPCIPVGEHRLRLYSAGEKDRQYRAYYDKRIAPGWHMGMVEIIAPPREAILFHVGNTLKDTLGCVLAGTAVLRPGNLLDPDHWAINGSRAAYETAYPILRDACLAGEAALVITEAFGGGTYA